MKKSIINNGYPEGIQGNTRSMAVLLRVVLGTGHRVVLLMLAVMIQDKARN